MDFFIQLTSNDVEASADLGNVTKLSFAHQKKPGFTSAAIRNTVGVLINGTPILNNGARRWNTYVAFRSIATFFGDFTRKRQNSTITHHT